MNSDYDIYFPKECCYPNQREAMDAIYQALIKKQIVLFEGACGTGKTLSALAPALYIGKKEKKTVVIATNVHQQMAQFIEEAREIKKQADIKIVVLKGKMLMCPRPDMDYDTCSSLSAITYKSKKQLIELETDFNRLKEEIESVKDKLKRTKDTSLIEFQRKLSQESDKIKEQIDDIKKRSCSLLLEILKNDNNDFSTWLFSGVRAPEEIEEWALRNNKCGYELLKRYMKEADLLICNYHHLLSEDIRTNVLGWMEKGLKDIIVIFDEAHNIESAARSSMELTEQTINKALDEIETNKKDTPSQDVETFLRVLLDTLKSTYNAKFKFGERERVGSDWYDFRIADPEDHIDMFKDRLLKAEDEAGIKNPAETIDHMKCLGLAIDAFYERQFIEGKSPIKKTSNVLKAADFLSDYMKLSNDMSYYPILSVRRYNNEIYGRLELLTCVPKIVTEPLFNSIHAAVLMSATLAPFETVKTTLGISRETCELAYGLSFLGENRLTIGVSTPPLFARERDNPQTKDLITKVLSDIIEQSDGNVLIFFPSFNEAHQYKNKLKCSVDVFLDEVGVSSQPIKEKFFQIGESGKKAVLISYMWGTLTEGVDYKGKRCRTVVIVGVGYPAQNDRMKAIKSAYEAEFGVNGWDYVFKIPTIRRVRQAVGRVIRSSDDFGVRVLLDERYTTSSSKSLGKYSVHNIFPEEERSEIIDVIPERVKYSILNFFNNIIKKRQMEQAENEKCWQQIEDIQNDNKYREAKIKEIEAELTKIKKPIEDINSYINSALCFITNPKIIDNDPSIEKRAKRYYEKQAKKLGLSGKSPSELQGIIENKEKELENHNKRKDTLIHDINKEGEKISLNNARIQEIGKRLSSI